MVPIEAKRFPGCGWSEDARQQFGMLHHMELHAQSFAEALSYFPDPDDCRLGPEEYLEQIGRFKKTVSLPVIASLNGISAGGWERYRL